MSLGREISFIGKGGAGIWKSGPRVQNLGLTIARNHYNRVIAAGGVMPISIAALANFINNIATAFNITSQAAFEAQFPRLLGPLFGVEQGDGSGSTLGQACKTLFNVTSASSDLSQGTAASQPLLLMKDTASNYIYYPAVSGNYVSTSNAAANQIVGNFEATFKIDLLDYSVPSTYTICAKRTVSEVAYHFAIVASGSLFLRTSSAGNPLQAGGGVTCSVSLTTVATNGQPIWIRVYRDSATGDVSFFYRLSDSGAFTQIGVTSSSYVGGIFNLATPLEIGAFSTGTTSLLRGNIYQGYLATSSGGAAVVNYTPNSYNASVSQTQFTSATGETYTLNVGTAATGYKLQIVTNAPILMADGIDDQMLTATVANYQYISRIIAARTFNTINLSILVSGANDRHAIYRNLTAIAAFNGVNLNMSSDVSNLLKYYQADFNALTSETFINNAGATSGDTGTDISDIVRLFRNVSSAIYANSTCDVLIDSSTILTTPQRLVVYNAVRALFNNAF
jgi:hypothetical protein